MRDFLIDAVFLMIAYTIGYWRGHYVTNKQWNMLRDQAKDYFKRHPEQRSSVTERFE